ncbi:MAG: hypothetical protein WCR85_00325 [Sphaerochaeta sp.]
MKDDDYFILKQTDAKAQETGPYVRKGRYFSSTSAESQQFIKENIDKIGEVVSIVACEDGRVDFVGTKGTLRPDGFAIGYMGTGPTKLYNLMEDLGLVEKSTVRNMKKAVHDPADPFFGCCRFLYRAPADKRK